MTFRNKKIGLKFLGLAWMGAALLSSHSARAESQSHRPHIDVRLMSEESSARPGGKLHVGLFFQMEKGWHIYWINAGDSGQAPKIHWTLPSGVTAGPIEWPAPERLAAGPLVDYGYRESILLPATLSVGSRLKNELPIHADIHWLVCQESCIPGRAKLDLSVPVHSGQAARGPDATFFDEVSSRLPKPLPSSWKQSVLAGAKEFEIRLQGALPSGVKSAQFFPLESEQIANASSQFFSLASGKLAIRVTKSEQLSKNPAKLQGLVVLDGVPYGMDAPVRRVSKLAPLVSPKLSTAQAPEKPISPPASNGGSLLRAIWFAFLGGLILNLMPCVFPVLSIKALSLLSMRERGLGDVRAEGFAYTLGVLVSFWMFATAILMLRTGGRALGWGFQLQSPLFVAGLALLFFLMALNLFGVFEISLGGAAGAGGKLTASPGHRGAFFTGALATVVATPCTAPFMGTALGFAMRESALGVFAIFSALGIGMAVPFLSLSLEPRLARALPRPGRWMETFRQFLGFPLLATVIWLVWVFGLQAGQGAVAVLLASLLLAAIGAWAMGRWRGVISRAVFVAFLILAIGVVQWGVNDSRIDHATGGSVEAAEGSPAANRIAWEKFSRSRLQQLQAEGKPAFVDFTAAWCVTCQVNDRVALERSDVVAAMKKTGVVALRGDWTNGDPEITRTLAEFGRDGVPLYLFYSGKAGEKPHVLPQILTPGVVLDEIHALSEGKTL